MLNRGATTVAVALAFLASVQTAFCQTTENCEPQTGIRCYWIKAEKYGVKVLIPEPGNETEYLKHVCASEQQLPKQSMCETFYVGCNASEKAKFKRQEEGYGQLQQAVTDSEKCNGVRNLTACIAKDVIANCHVHFDKYPTHESARKNHEAAVNLTNCLNESLAACGEEYSDSKKYIQSIANALTLLYWHHEPRTTPAPATSEPPTTPTSVPTEAPTHETSQTTEKTVTMTEQTTQHPHPTEHTTGEPVTTTTPSTSTEPATTNPTETPTPATTPKPSGAATGVPFVGALVAITAVWLAQAA